MPGRRAAAGQLEDNWLMLYDAIAERRIDVRDHKEIARRSGVRLVCYEGGQHWAGGDNAAENDPLLIAALYDANRSPAMGDRYREYLAMLEEEGVDLYCNFEHIGGWGRSQSFPVFEYQGQPLSDAPKAAALVEFIQAAQSARDHPLTLRLDVPSPHLSIELNSGTKYTLQSSIDLSTWSDDPALTAVPGKHTRISHPVVQLPTEPRRFWRLMME